MDGRPAARRRQPSRPRPARRRPPARGRLRRRPAQRRRVLHRVPRRQPGRSLPRARQPPLRGPGDRPGSSPTPAPRCSSPTSGSPAPPARPPTRPGCPRATGTPSARSRVSGRTPNSLDGQPGSAPEDRELGWVMNYTSGHDRPPPRHPPAAARQAPRGGLPRRLPRHLRHQAVRRQRAPRLLTAVPHRRAPVRGRLPPHRAPPGADGQVDARGDAAPDRRPPVHPHPYGPDPVPPAAGPPGRHQGPATTSRPCGTPSTARRPAPTT